MSALVLFPDSFIYMHAHAMLLQSATLAKAILSVRLCVRVRPLHGKREHVK